MKNSYNEQKLAIKKALTGVVSRSDQTRHRTIDEKIIYIWITFRIPQEKSTRSFSMMMEKSKLLRRIQINLYKPQRNQRPRERSQFYLLMMTKVMRIRISKGLSKLSNNLRVKKAKNLGDCRIDFMVITDSRLIHGSWKEIAIMKMMKRNKNGQMKTTLVKALMTLKRMKVTNGNGN